MSEVLSEAAREYLKWALIDGVGPLTFGRLMNHFGSVGRLSAASASELAEVERVGPGRAEQIARDRDRVDVEEEIRLAAECGVRIVCREDPEYPPGLRQIPDAPIVLYIKGEYLPTDAVAIAVVGSRRCTIYGSEQARRFGELLAEAGFTVVSGLARGIDAFAHHGAVAAGGRTIAVLGCGLTTIYPQENRALAEKILENGALISELPLRASVKRENFPSRNRIMAGMTLGTLVIEAARRSGALITARLANDYNREVFAVPGRLQEPMSEGTNALIRDGIAKLVTNLDDILDELGEVGYRMKLKRQELEAAGSPQATACSDPDREQARQGDGSRGRLNLSALEQRVYEVIGYDERLQDVIIRAAELPAGEVLAAITSLELKGLVRRLPGNLIVRRGRA
jgi:DNA processing protein